MTLIIQILITIALLFALSFYFVIRMNKQKSEFLNHENELNKDFQDKITELSIAAERLVQARRQVQDFQLEVQALRQKNEDLNSIMIRQNAENKFLKEKIEEQAREFERLQKQATSEFENLANRILKKNTEDFSEVNQKKINELVLPLKEKIQGFEKKVEETYEKGLKDQTDLKAELKKLYELNNKISTEANNLTRALKGDVKQQGNWGEVILEKILERSGLKIGQEYSKQFSTLNDNGQRIQPDVVINLPDQKHIIVDSKVSLIAYERWVNASTDEERSRYMKEHLISMKSHIKGLSEKHYQTAQGINSPDFVLLFVPIESSFSVAIEADQDLFSYAWDNKVVIVSPSTLLATLRTIASIWQQENQTRNAMEIARQSGALYDKFVGFISDIEKLGKSIDGLQKTYDDASKKLYTGAGNLVRRVEKLKELGASASKEIPDAFKAIED